MLAESKSKYFLDFVYFTMVDIFAFPYVSRTIHMKGSLLNSLYDKLELEQRYPKTIEWEKHMRTLPEFKDVRFMINVRPYQLFIEDFVKTAPGAPLPKLKIPYRK